MLRAAPGLALPLALACLPFELAGGLGLGPLTLTNVELLILLVLGLWAAALLVERRRPRFPAWLILGAVVLLIALALGAAFALEQRAGAFKFSLRQACGAALACCLADSLRARPGLAARCALALVAGGGLSAALGLWEMSETPLALSALAPFKTESSFVGGLLRLSGTLSYANTAAMYYEALLPLALLAALAGFLAGGRRLALGWLLLAAALLLAALLTYSRTALAVCALLLIATPALAWIGLGRRIGRLAGSACAGLACAGIGLAILDPTVGLRLIEPDVARWYGATYNSEQPPALAPNQLTTVRVELRNSGRVAWEPDGPRPVRLSYHWLDADSGRVVRFEGRRTELPRRVLPGETITVMAALQAPPQPGRYVLAWDMLREYIGRGWFSQMGIAPARLELEVAGPAAPSAPPPADPPGAPRVVAEAPGPPGRRELWGLALTLWSEHPLLGVGPDVFRHIYGPRLGLEPFDDRVHTNNLYLELLLGAGPIALLAFLGLAGAAMWVGWRSLGRGAADWVLLGALLGLLAFLAHGLLDVFLAFTPTYALMWALFGIVAGLSGREARG